ncbi:hypothetical protein MGI18_09665 [Bacillus sp. OVS6]|nr:hypothetical protein MGI18_09665 [Bacillus sp. OVS6]
MLLDLTYWLTEFGIAFFFVSNIGIVFDAAIGAMDKASAKLSPVATTARSAVPICLAILTDVS